MIDIHTHLLPDVDDGSPSYEVSVAVLERFVAQGVSILVCTPHLNASQAGTAPFEEHAAILQELRRRLPAEIELQLGWEIMLDVPGANLTAPGLALGDSDAVLVEFTRGGVPRDASAELRRILRSGRTPVLAHPERYFGCSVELVQQWRDLGVIIQTDASVLLGRGAPSVLARELLTAGLIDILASDNHGDDRSLESARQWLVEQQLEEHAVLLTRINADCVLNSEDPLPVPPLPPGLFDRFSFRKFFGR